MCKITTLGTIVCHSSFNLFVVFAVEDLMLSSILWMLSHQIIILCLPQHLERPLWVRGLIFTM